MISQIELKEMRFYAHHGVGEQETKVGNQFVVNILLTTPLEQAIQTDELIHTINYAEVFELVKHEMNIPSKLLEHAAGRILYRLRKAFPQLTAAQVKLAKLNPPFGGDVYSAAVLLSENWNM